MNSWTLHYSSPCLSPVAQSSLGGSWPDAHHCIWIPTPFFIFDGIYALASVLQTTICLAICLSLLCSVLFTSFSSTLLLYWCLWRRIQRADGIAWSVTSAAAPCSLCFLLYFPCPALLLLLFYPSSELLHGTWPYSWFTGRHLLLSVASINVLNGDELMSRIMSLWLIAISCLCWIGRAGSRISVVGQDHMTVMWSFVVVL